MTKKRALNPVLIILIIIFIGSLINLFIGLPKIEWVELIVSILSALIIIEGIFSIDNKPPHIGLITFLGKKIWKNDKPVIVKEGLKWVFLKGIIFNFIPINVELKRKEFEPQKILGADNINVGVPISYAYNVDGEESHTYINVGNEIGVDEAIKDTLEGRLREYSRNSTEGPMTWKEMIASGLKTLDYLIKSLSKSEGKSIEENMGPISDIEDGYDHLVKISNIMPTPILLDWFRKKDPPNSVVRKEWGDGKKWDAVWSKEFEKRWQILENKIKELAGFDPENTTEVNEKAIKDFKKNLNERIEKRIVILEKLQQGKAKIKIINYGIYLTRLTVGDVSPFGEIYEAEIALQREEKERKSETYEVETDLAKAKILQDAIKELHQKDVDITECFNAIMKWKMISSGKGFVYDGQLGNFAGLGNLISSIMEGGKK